MVSVCTRTLFFARLSKRGRARPLFFSRCENVAVGRFHAVFVSLSRGKRLQDTFSEALPDTAARAAPPGRVSGFFYKEGERPRNPPCVFLPGHGISSPLSLIAQ